MRQIREAYPRPHRLSVLRSLCWRSASGVRVSFQHAICGSSASAHTAGSARRRISTYQETKALITEIIDRLSILKDQIAIQARRTQSRV